MKRNGRRVGGRVIIGWSTLHILQMDVETDESAKKSTARQQESTLSIQRISTAVLFHDGVDALKKLIGVQPATVEQQIESQVNNAGVANLQKGCEIRQRILLL